MTPVELPDDHHDTHTAHGSGLSPRGLLLSEWITLTSLRSTVWCFGIILLITLGLGLLLAASVPQREDHTAALDQGYWMQNSDHQPVGGRCSRSARHHRRMRHRDDPVHPHRGAQASVNTYFPKLWSSGW